MRRFSDLVGEERHSIVSDRLIESMSVTNEKKEQQTSCLNNWITLSLIAACMFSLRIIIVGEMTTLGFDGLYFFSTGSTLMSSLFFTYRKEWAKLNNPLDINDEEKKKVLLRTWGNKFDYCSLAVVFLAGLW